MTPAATGEDESDKVKKSVATFFGIGRGHGRRVSQARTINQQGEVIARNRSDLWDILHCVSSFDEITAQINLHLLVLGMKHQMQI